VSVTTLGSLANGLYLTSNYVPTTSTTNSTVVLFNKQMKAISPTATRDEVALRSWVSIRFFAALLKQKGLSAPTSAHVLSALNGLSTPIPLGALTPYKVVGAKPLLPSTPRILNSVVGYNVVKNGVITQSGSFVNPVAQLKSAKA
jgi:hypothetical protein